MVGAIGYLIDAGSLLVLVQIVGFPPLPARVLSFMIAASVTFVLNQYFTFRFSGKLTVQRWSLYMAVTAIGATLNIGIYHAWVLRTDSSMRNLVIGTAIGSLVAMAANYTVSRALVFRQSPVRPSARDQTPQHNTQHE
jgi:putative flippase GtrA